MVSQSAFWLRSVAYLIAMAHQDSSPCGAAIEAQVVALAQTASSTENEVALLGHERVGRGATGRRDAFPMIWRCRAWREPQPARSSPSALGRPGGSITPSSTKPTTRDSGTFFCRGIEGPNLRAGERIHVLVLRKWVLAGRSNRRRQNPAARALSHKCAEHLKDGGCPVEDQRGGIS